MTVRPISINQPAIRFGSAIDALTRREVPFYGTVIDDSEEDSVDLSAGRPNFDLYMTLGGEPNKRISVRQCGNLASDDVTIYLPGITRNKKDFGPMSEYLEKHYPNSRIIMPDPIGRGQSGNLDHPEFDGSELFRKKLDEMKNDCKSGAEAVMETFLNPLNFTKRRKAWGKAFERLVKPFQPLAQQDRNWELFNALFSSHYNLQTYEEQILELIRQMKLGNKNLTLIGTSQGGAVALRIAARVPAVKRLAMIDIGPEFPKAGIENLGLGQVAGKALPDYGSLEEAKAALKERYSAPSRFGNLPEAEWDILAEASFTRLKNGRYVYDFDPKLLDPFKNANLFASNPVVNGLANGITANLSDMWADWDYVTRKLKKPVFAMVGKKSLLTPKHVVDRMKDSPNVTLEGIDGVGHAPMLTNEAQQRLVTRWLRQTEAALYKDHQERVLV